MYEYVTIEEIKYTHKWKSSGIDKITNFGLYDISSTYQLMTKFISKIIKEPEKIGSWNQQPKTKEAANAKYNKNSSLPTTYKMITSFSNGENGQIHRV